MENISPRSRRDLESYKHHGEILARSHQSRQDLVNLGEISSISARSLQSWRDLGKNFARVRMQFCLGALNNVLFIFFTEVDLFLRYYVCKKACICG